MGLKSPTTQTPTQEIWAYGKSTLRLSPQMYSPKSSKQFLHMTIQLFFVATCVLLRRGSSICFARVFAPCTHRLTIFFLCASCAFVLCRRIHHLKSFHGRSSCRNTFRDLLVLARFVVVDVVGNTGKRKRRAV